MGLGLDSVGFVEVGDVGSWDELELGFVLDDVVPTVVRGVKWGGRTGALPLSRLDFLEDMIRI